MDNNLRHLLEIPTDRLDAINAVLLDPDEHVINDFLKVVEKYGAPQEINRQHAESRKLPNLLEKVAAKNPDYVQDLEWLMEQRDRSAFTSVEAYRRKILGAQADGIQTSEVSKTSEVSAIEAEIDLAAAELWGISAKELAEIRKSLEEL